MIIGHAWSYNLSTFSLYSHYSGGVWGWSVGLLANNLNRFTTFDHNNGIPSGYNPHYTWAPPLKGSGLGAWTIAEGEVYDALMAGAKNCSATLSGLGIVSEANFALIVSMLATVQAGGVIDNAALAGILAMAATVQSTGEISEAALSAIINFLATITADGGVTYADILGECFCSAHIYVNEGAATTDQIVNAIWDELTAEHTGVGTTGKALTDAGGAGNPWSAMTSSNDDPGTFGELVQDTKQGVISSQGLILGA